MFGKLIVTSWRCAGGWKRLWSPLKGWISTYPLPGQPEPVWLDPEPQLNLQQGRDSSAWSHDHLGSQRPGRDLWVSCG